MFFRERLLAICSAPLPPFTNMPLYNMVIRSRRFPSPLMTSLRFPRSVASASWRSWALLFSFKFWRKLPICPAPPELSPWGSKASNKVSVISTRSSPPACGPLAGASPAIWPAISLAASAFSTASSFRFWSRFP